jgi:HEPN domain-containing protein
LILESTLPKDKEVMLNKITSGAKMHNVEVLIGILKDLECPIPLEIVKRLRQSRSRWSTALRYKSGRVATGHTRGFLKTAKAVYDWVGRQLP